MLALWGKHTRRHSDLCSPAGTLKKDMIVIYSKRGGFQLNHACYCVGTSFERLLMVAKRRKDSSSTASST